MVALIQRVKKASVKVDDTIVGEIGKGLLILLGVHTTDTEEEMKWVAQKSANLRIFSDEEGRMNLSVVDVAGAVMVVSQFTLYGNTRKGNRPSFIESAPPEQANALYQAYIEEMEHLLDKPVPSGIFGAMMDVTLVNDGPVTLWVEKRRQEKE